MNDNQNVTFSAFFKLTLLTLTGNIIFVTTIIPSYHGQNGLILSHFLMLSLAFAYVILLYIVYTKLQNRILPGSVKSGIMSENRVICWIYGIRMAIKAGILIYILAEACRSLVLKRYGSAAVAVPILIAAVYMGRKGLKGVIRFAEAIFWFSCAAGVIILASSLRNLDFSQLQGYISFYGEGGINITVNRIMVRGGLMFLGFSLLEMLMLVYLRIADRRRGMLAGAALSSAVIGIIGSIIVTITLGMDALSSGDKSILYMVGAMELPNGTKIRPLIFACYLVIVWGMMAILPHVVCGFGVIETACGEKSRRRVKWMWALLVCATVLWLQNIPTTDELFRIVPCYLALVDVPLSLILPAVAAIGRRRMGRVMSCVILCTVSGMLTSCAYEPIENVDYMNVIVIEESDVSDMLEYTLVITGLDDDEESVAEESVYEVRAGTFAKACEAYNEEHPKLLDTSHVEYVVAESEEVLDRALAELEREFATSYVTVIIAGDIMNKSEDCITKDYLATHYTGECLATWRR